MTASANKLDNTGLAFGLVIAAGLSTAIGAAAVFVQRMVQLASKPVLAAGLGFSGGVMLYVSFIEIFVKSLGSFGGGGYTEKGAYYTATLCTFAGMVLLRLIAFLVHKIDKDHDKNFSAEAAGLGDVNVSVPSAASTQEEGGTDASAVAAAEGAQAKKLTIMGVNTAIAIAIHNFPEGLATFVATLDDPEVGVTLAIAIAVHNIPEGLCVALPIYYATGSRLKGFLCGLLSGISEPVGAFIGWVIIKSTGEDMNQVVYGILFGLVAGMMIMIVLLELLPTGFKYDPTDKVVSTSVVVGMAVMALSLCLFQA